MDSISLSEVAIVIQGSSAKAYTKQFTLFNHAHVSLQGVVTPHIPGIRIEPRVFSINATTPSLNFTISIDSKVYLSHKTKKPPVRLSEQITIITTIGKKEITLKFEYIKESALQSALLSSPAPKTSQIERITPHISERKSRKNIHKIHKRTAYLKNGESLKLSSIGQSGGEGEIYVVKDHDRYCAKLFHPHSITPELAEKIEYMVSNPLSPSLISSVAWPTASLYDKTGVDRRLLGFLMPYIDPSSYVEAHKWYDPQDRKKQKKAPLTLAERVSVIYQLATAIQGLHALGHAVGDLRETNLLIGPKGIIIIDCDSFQIQKAHSPSFYPTRVATPEYLPLETQGKDFSKQSFSRIDSDRFALAVLIFKILMDGVHPYQSQGRLVAHAPSTADKIKLGYFAFDGKLPGLSPPPYAPNYRTHVPDAFARCFTKTFVQGHKEPTLRTSPEQFITACTVAMPDLFPPLPPSASSRPRTSSLPSHPSSSSPLLKKQDEKKREDIPLPSPSVPAISSQQVPKATLRSPYCTNNGISIVPGQLLWKMPTGTVYEVGSGTVYNAVFSSTYDLNSQPSCPAYGKHLSSLLSQYPSSLNNMALWPQTLIYHHQNEKEPIGYLIHAFDRDSWHEWHECAVSSSTFQARLISTKNLADIVKQLHAKKYAAGHLSDRTILVSERGEVKLISVDASAGHTKKSLLQYPEFSPDRYCHASNDDPFYCDRFALAVLIFMMIMNGAHPFHADNQKTEQDYTESPPQSPNDPSASVFSYGSIFSFQTISNQYSEYGYLPARLRAMFYRAFATRMLPDPAEWYALLTDLEGNALHCTANETHWYDRDQGYCPRCAESLPAIQALIAWLSCTSFPYRPHFTLLSPGHEEMQIWYMPSPRQYALTGHHLLLLGFRSHEKPDTSLIIYRPGFLITRDVLYLYLLLYLPEQVQCAWNDWQMLYTSSMQITCNEADAEYYSQGEQLIGRFDIYDSLEEDDDESDIIYEPIPEDLFEPIEPIEPIENGLMDMDTEESVEDESILEERDEKLKDSKSFWEYFTSIIWPK